MTVINLQKFITDYVRNPKIRRFPFGSIDQYNFDPGEKQLLKDLDFNILNKLAIDLQRKRAKRLEQQFPEFFEMIKYSGSYSDYLEEYLSKFNEAYITPENEMKNFIQFSTCYIENNNSPEYFIDVAKYCYYLSLTLIQSFETSPNEGDIKIDCPLQIVRPFNIIKLNYDFESIMEMIDGEKDKPIIRKHSIIVQKDFYEPGDLIINEVDEQLLDMLVSNYSLCEILNSFNNNEDVKEFVIDLYNSNSISHKEN